jgi:proline iminopeptidase
MYPDIQPYHTEYLAVSPLHNLYIEHVGNPSGIPVVVLHGGPGAGCSASQRRYFDPAFYHVILFDQRGAGRSTPRGELRDNTLSHLIEDIETIRQHLGIKQWLVFGGSWGSTLAIAYGIAHPTSCLGFILRGVFLMREFEVEWFVKQVRYFFPEAWASFIKALLLLSATSVSDTSRLSARDILELMQSVLDRGDVAQTDAMFAHMAWFEENIMFLTPQGGSPTPQDIMSNIGRIEHHYFRNHMQEDPDLIGQLGRINHLPCVIVQGRYDVVCPPITAYEVHQAWPGSELKMVIGGHSGSDPTVAQGLFEATETFKTLIGG